MSEDYRFKLQGKTKYQGIPVSIEQRKGSVCEGVDGDGKKWRTKMKIPYGRIPRTMGADGDAVDVFLASKKESPVHVVHQKRKDTGKYDEDKVFLGAKTKAQVKKLFLAHYDSPKFLGPISKMTIDEFKDLLKTKKGKKLTKTSTGDINMRSGISKIARHMMKESQYELEDAEGIYGPETYQQMQKQVPRLSEEEFTQAYKEPTDPTVPLLTATGGSGGAMLGGAIGKNLHDFALSRMKNPIKAMASKGKKWPIALAAGLGGLLGGAGGYLGGKKIQGFTEKADKQQLQKIYKALSGQEKQSQQMLSPLMQKITPYLHRMGKGIAKTKFGRGVAKKVLGKDVVRTGTSAAEQVQRSVPQLTQLQRFEQLMQNPELKAALLARGKQLGKGTAMVGGGYLAGKAL